MQRSELPQRSVGGWTVHLPRSVPWTIVALWVCGLAVATMILLPTVYLALRAMTTGDGVLRALGSPATWLTLSRTVWLAVAVTVLSLAIAVPLAWLLERTDLPWRGGWSVLLPLPLVIPSYVGAYLYVSALGPRGFVQQWLEQWVGTARVPSIYGFPGALLSLTLLGYPYILLSVRAGLRRIDPALEEASRSLGRTAWSTFGLIVLPQLRPALGAGSLLVALYVLRDFGAVALMRYDTFTRVIYVQYRSFDRSQAAVFALFLIALTLVIVRLESQLHGGARYHREGIGVLGPAKLVRLGHWRWPALVLCGSVTGLGLLLPLGVLLYWLVRGLRAGEALSTLGTATANSLTASGVGAVVVTVMALPVAVLVARHPGRWSRILRQVVYSAFALPGIAIALALVYFGINYARPLYQSLPMLILAYAILFLPQAFGSLRTGLLQIPPSLEEAARSLGRSPLAAFWSITAPLMRPAFLAGMSLVFLTAMKELPATLILAPTGFRTLATDVWSSVTEAFFARAAAPALLIVLLSSVPMTLFGLRNRQADV
jgi:iron(III) transport system permease protein